MSVADPLYQMVCREDFETIIKEARPAELVVIALRLEGLDNKKIAELLGISGSAVGFRIRVFRERVCAKHPDIAHMIQDRRMKPGRQRRIEFSTGWLVSCEGDQ